MQDIALYNNLSKEHDEIKEKDFGYIFETYYKRVYNYIFYKINSHHTSEDLTSKVFEKIMLKIDTYSEDKSSFEVWVFAIARNTINDYFRSIKKHKLISIDSIMNLVSRKQTPEDAVINLETNDEILKALNVLDKRERSIIELKFGADLKNKDIASLLNISESNVGVIIYRSMKKLKKQIKGSE